GVISQPSGILTKFGSGTLTLTGNSPNMPPTDISAGTLLVEGTAPAFSMNVSNGATLGGTGKIGPLAALSGSTGAPGDANPGTFHTGHAAFKATSTFRVRLNGIVDYDQLAVTGIVDLTESPVLNASLGFTPSVGDTFTIVTSTAGISGNFKGLQNNATLMIGGTPFQISYSAHSIVLKQAASDQPLVAKGTTFTATEGAAFSGVVATFTDADPQSTAASYTAQITWGDSHVSAGTVTQNGGVFQVSGTNTYVEEGSYAVTVQIRDIDTSHDAGGSLATANG